MVLTTTPHFSTFRRGLGREEHRADRLEPFRGHAKPGGIAGDERRDVLGAKPRQSAVRLRDQRRQSWRHDLRGTKAGSVVEQPSGGGDEPGSLGMLGRREQQVPRRAQITDSNERPCPPDGELDREGAEPSRRPVHLVGSGSAGGSVAAQAMRSSSERRRDRS